MEIPCISNKFQAKTKSYEKPILVYSMSGWIDHKGSKIYEDKKSLAMQAGNWGWRKKT